MKKAKIGFWAFTRVYGSIFVLYWIVSRGTWRALNEVLSDEFGVAAAISGKHTAVSVTICILPYLLIAAVLFACAPWHNVWPTFWIALGAAMIGEGAAWLWFAYLKKTNAFYFYIV